MKHYKTIVIGAGIHGLSAARAASSYGSVLLLEARPFLHHQGSSHGSTRITRSTYHAATYVRLMQQAHTEFWPQLEKEADEQLIFRQDGVFWGPAAGPLPRYKRAVLEAGADVVVLEPEEAKKRFPMFHFADCKEVLWDRTGGVIAANRTLRALLKICGKRGVELKDQTPVLNIEGGYTITVETPEGKLGADHLILCAGPWSQRLLQCMALWFPLTPVRQTVGYWKPDLPRFDSPHFPTWVHLGKEGLHYGLPAFLPEQPGIKAAFHRTSGKEDDPDAAAAPADLSPVAAFLAEQLSVTLGEPLGAENCFYTNTPTEDFYLLRHPMYHNISIGAGFSGHGFKFGPLIGQILAALAHGKATGVPAFDRDKYRFSPLDLL